MENFQKGIDFVTECRYNSGTWDINDKPRGQAGALREFAASG